MESKLDRNLFYMTLVFSFLIIPTLIGYIFVSYIKSLEEKDCPCSSNIRRKYVKYYGYFLFGIAVASIFLIILTIKNPKLKKYNELLKVISIIVNFLAAYLLYEYSQILDNEHNNCRCSDDWKKVFMKYYSYFLIVVIGLIFFSLLMTFLAHISTGNDSYILLMKRSFIGC